MELNQWLDEKGYALNEINRQGEHGYTALMRAAKDGEVAIVRELLSLPGIDLSLTNVDGNNVLWNGCFADSIEIVSMLLDAGVALDNINDNGVTALMYTASSGKEVMTRLLIDKGADVTIRNLDDFSALDLASTIAIVRMLKAAS